MDFNNMIVSVEINDTSLRGLQESGTIATVTTLRDEEVSSTQSAPRTNQFRVKGVSQGLVSPYEERSAFALQSVSSEAYLAINSSDRTVMLLDEQFPPPDAFCFKFAAEHGPFSVEVPCSIQPLDQGPVKDAVDPGITLSLCIRAMQTSLEKLKAVESQYNQQLSIIAALQQANAVTRDESDDIHADHDPLSGDHSAHSAPIKRGKDSDGGREKSYLDSEKMIARAKEMIDSGDLKVAKEALGRFYDDDNLPKTVEKSVLIKIAKLFVILSDTVYFRDAVYRDAVLKSASMCKDDANKWWTENSSWSEWAEWSTYFQEVESHDDQARTRINLVASKLGLKFQPLCNLSQPHEIGLGGPYCGAFYDDGDNPFIVLAIKGTGSLSDWYTNFMVATTAGNSGSPLNGQVHHGFYRGFFDGSYPVGLRGPQGPKFKFETGLPFQMLRLQLWRLEKQILSARPRTPNVNTRVQLWTTGHSLGGAYATILWSALLDQPKMLDSTIRDLVTFGAPRVGDREFVEDLMRVKGERKIWRFVNGADVVPRILYYGVGITYYHPDTLINCFPYSIYRGSTELGPQPPDSWVPQGLKDILKEIYRLVVHSEDPIKDVKDYKNDHELERYWITLREGSKSIGEGSW